VPDFARTERNLVLRLILTLRAFGMRESELVREFELSGYVLDDVVPPRQDDPDEHDHDVPAILLLRRLMAAHTGIHAPAFEKVIRSERFDDEGERVLGRTFRLLADEELEALEQSLRAAYFFVEDEVEDRAHIGSALYGLVHQRMLPGQ